MLKADSDNFRQSAIQGIMSRLRDRNIGVVLYEPQIYDLTFDGYEVIKDFSQFLDSSDVIIANRITPEIERVKKKVYTRDIFREN